MARIRTVKPEFWQDEDLAETSETARLVAIGLLNCADDEGFFNANVKLIKSFLFPITEPSVSIHECLTQLVNSGYLKLYKCKQGKKTYGHVINFDKHQKVNRANPSKIRLLVDFTEYSVSAHEQITLGTGNREQGSGNREGSKRSCSELRSKPPKALSNIILPLNKKNTIHQVTLDEFNEYKLLYPSVDVIQQFRNMLGWLNANPSRKKTKSGIKKFINSWLSKEQNEGGNHAITGRSNHQINGFGQQRAMSAVDKAKRFIANQSPEQ